MCGCMLTPAAGILYKTTAAAALVDAACKHSCGVVVQTCPAAAYCALHAIRMPDHGHP